MSVPEHPSIHLLNSRPWIYKLGISGLDSVSDEQLALVTQGADIVWLQGCWEIGEYGPKHDLADPGRRRHFEACLAGEFTEDDCIGSPYAISEYKLSKTLGTDEDLAKFRQRLHTCGRRLMLDFVPNHMARDSPWVALPHLFIEGLDGPVFGSDPYSGDWTDTAQLNYWSETCREHMMQELLKIAEKCDGVRIDMAMLCCNSVIDRKWGHMLRQQGFVCPSSEFWPNALARVRHRFPNFLLLAECYEYQEIFPGGTGVELLQQGFHAVYDKCLYDRLADGHMDRLRAHLFDNHMLREGRLCHFTENHDEDRSVVHFACRAQAATVASLTLPGPRMFMWGQMDGCRERLAVQLRRCKKEETDSLTRDFFLKLLKVLPVCQGSWSPLTSHGDDAWRFIAWGWLYEHSAVLVVINFTDTEAWGNIKILDVLTGCTRKRISLVDILSGEVYDRSTDDLRGPDGLVVGLKPYQSHIFLCKIA